MDSGHDNTPNRDEIRQSELLRLNQLHDEVIQKAVEKIPQGHDTFTVRDTSENEHPWTIHLRKYDVGVNVEALDLLPRNPDKQPETSWTVLTVDTNSGLTEDPDTERVLPYLDFAPTKRLRVWGMVADQFNRDYLTERQQYEPDILNNSFTDYYVGDGGKMNKVCSYIYYLFPQYTPGEGIRVVEQHGSYDTRINPVTEDDIEIAGSCYRTVLAALSQ